MSIENSVRLVGNLGRDPEVRTTPSGTTVANFSMATNEKYKDKSGQQQEKVEWHRIIVFGKLADICGKYLFKGKEIILEGKLQTRKWQDRDGNDRYTTEIIAERMKMLGGKGEDKSQKNYGESSSSDSPPIIDDDIPF